MDTKNSYLLNLLAKALRGGHCDDDGCCEHPFCFARDIVGDSGLPEEDVARLADEKGFVVFVVEPTDEIIGDYVIADNEAALNDISGLYESFYETKPTIKRYGLKEGLNKDEVESKVKEIISNYEDEAKSRLSVAEGKLTYHAADPENNADERFEFELYGGKNGSGEWEDYFKDLSEAFKEIHKETGWNPRVDELSNDMLDDVFTTKVVLFREDVDGDSLEESLKKLDEKKRKKPHVNKVGDPNAKAMWGRTRSQTFKAKKGKGSFKRKPRNGKIFEEDGSEYTLVQTTEDELESFKQKLISLDFEIESCREYSSIFDESVHYWHLQIKSNFKIAVTQEAFNNAMEEICDELEAWREETNVHFTYSFGLMEDGTITAGLDIREKQEKLEYTDIALDDGSVDETDESLNEGREIPDESIDAFVKRVKKELKLDDVKVIESLLNEAKADIDRFIEWGGQELYDRFLKQKNRLQGQQKDIMYWTSKKNPHEPEELDAILTELEGKKTRSQSDAEAKAGAEKVAENENWEVYKINTFAASQKYGKNAQWCISGSKRWVRGDMQPETYWNQYTQRDHVQFYFFLRKDETDKFAFAIYPNGNRAVYNAKDEWMNKTQINKELNDAPAVDGVFLPPELARKRKNLPHLKNAKQLGYVFTDLDDYIYQDNMVIEFRRKTKGTAIIPDGIVGIEDLCFAGKTELTEVIIPKEVTYVGVYAFYKCGNLKIKAEAESKPEGWDDEWNPDNTPVEWGYTEEGDGDDGFSDVRVVDHL